MGGRAVKIAEKNRSSWVMPPLMPTIWTQEDHHWMRQKIKPHNIQQQTRRTNIKRQRKMSTSNYHMSNESGLDCVILGLSWQCPSPSAKLKQRPNFQQQVCPCPASLSGSSAERTRRPAQSVCSSSLCVRRHGNQTARRRQVRPSCSPERVYKYQQIICHL